MSAMVEEGLYEPRAVRPWVVWVLFLVPILGTAHLLWWHVELLAKIAPAFYLPIVAALPLALVTVWAVHRLRNRHSSWILWAVLPVLPLCLLLLRRPTASVVAVLMTGASLSAGRIVARLLRVPDSLPVLAGLTNHFSVGLAISTGVLVLLGMAGWLNWAICAALLLPALLFTRFWWIEIRTAWNRWREFLSSGEAKSPVVTTVLVWSGILLLLAVASAATPALHGDSLRFHLALAKIYATQASL
ncbi:MAG TPA: hypothetical protein VEQ63_15170, partial [Bryobacteraceae bacterium]|nr:hypothetical protein [Bryobacteraceae bacterium]